MKKAILYTRVAPTLEHESDKALERQISELQNYCRENDFEVVKVYSEVAPSKTFDRQEFKKLLSDIRTKKVKADALLFVSWYRLSTNVKQTILIYNELKKEGVELKAIDDSENSKVFLKIIKLINKRK